MEIKHPNIETIRIFGSVARKEDTQNSDYDVLVVLKSSQQIDEDIISFVKAKFSIEISISWYCKKRIAQMFSNGHLFAWHLYLESKQLIDGDFIQRLGKPKDYEFSKVDILSLRKILAPIKLEMITYPRNLIYELGIMYVCVRNIAICAAPVLNRKYVFGVYAPYEVDYPISKPNYETILNCRYASIRGFDEPTIHLSEAINIYNMTLDWCNKILKKVTLINDEYEHKKKVYSAS